MQPTDYCTLIDGEEFFTIKSFALAINRPIQSIRFLITYGNRIRKLQVVYKGKKPYIPFSELLDFPFTKQGRDFTVVYHYRADGSIYREDTDVPVQD